jgi:hypothetical protein
MEKASYKQVIWVLIIFFGLILIAKLYTYYFFTNTTKTCATIYKVGADRTIESYHYSYSAHGIIHDRSIETGYIKNISLDSLKKIECVKIEYSNYVNSFSRVIDQSLLK